MEYGGRRSVGEEVLEVDWGRGRGVPVHVPVYGSNKQQKSKTFKSTSDFDNQEQFSSHTSDRLNPITEQCVRSTDGARFTAFVCGRSRAVYRDRTIVDIQVSLCILYAKLHTHNGVLMKKGPLVLILRYHHKNSLFDDIFNHLITTLTTP